MFEYRPKPAFPRLAWVATVPAGGGPTVVAHGRDVETRPGFFLEGAWAGDFGRGRPDETEVVFGSGAVAAEDGILFVPSLATTDYLFYKETAAGVVVANSLPLLLAAVEDELDPSFRGYADLNDSITRGIDEYERRIPTRGGFVMRVMHRNLRVGSSGAAEAPKPEPPPFPAYEAYASYLAASYASLAANARDAGRRRPLKIYSTQSRGYDSTAVNSIAARHGLDGVFTVKTGKGGGAFSDQPDEPEADDDGGEIARAFGVAEITPLERRAFLKGFPEEIYYHASISEPQDANFKQASDLISAPALLLTGTLGEMWYTDDLLYKDNPALRKPDLRRTDISLHGLTEPRLRAGYVQAAIPYIGARRRAEILKITESAEMAPWRVGGSYDRPIPRRLAESAGIPRAAFGRTKVGSVVEFTPPQLPRDPVLRAAYARFLRDEGLCGSARQALFPLVHRFNRAATFATDSRYRLVHYAWRAASKLAGRDIPPKLLWSGLRGSLHCFAVNRCVREYAAALAAPLKRTGAGDIL